MNKKDNLSQKILESVLTESQFKSNEQGECPVCGEEDLDYDAAQFEGVMMYLPWKCNKCKAQGEEWYHLQFSGHSVNTENGYEEVDMGYQDEFKAPWERF